MANPSACVIVGASHAGVNCAFALRKEGWEGEIILLDADPHLPYHRPPLSKTYLSSEEDFEVNILKSAESYVDARIDLRLGVAVAKIESSRKILCLDDGSEIDYNKLVLAVGARAYLPPFKGLKKAKNLFTLRNASDAFVIRKAFRNSKKKRIFIIGGGYIGLETAASLKKLGGNVTILERESRVLARVTAPEMSEFFKKLHSDNGVLIHNHRSVKAFEADGECTKVCCDDGSIFLADIVIVGVGIKVNVDLAEQAGLKIENGICVDQTGKTSDIDIYAIGDCAFQYNAQYGRQVRLESVQNAVDQAKTAAANICGKVKINEAIPWFWSDQYDVKLQMVGLSRDYDELILRYERDKALSFSVWYFMGEQLLSVDAVNNAKAYVLGSKFIKGGQKINKVNLADANIDLKPANLIQS